MVGKDNSKYSISKIKSKRKGPGEISYLRFGMTAEGKMSERRVGVLGGTHLRGWMDGYARRQSDDTDDVSRRRRARVTVWEIGRDKQEKKYED